MASKRPSDSEASLPPKRRQLGSTSALIDPYLRWDVSKIPTSFTLPPLPKPADPILERQAFTHISLGNNGENYEELEWLGDSWIQYYATQLLSKTFRGTVKTGRLSQMREHLVRNKTLGSFLRAYDLHHQIRLSSEILEGSQEPTAKAKRRTKNPLTTLEKIHGDVFEAYVGAIIESEPDNGVRIAQGWLKILWAWELRDELRELAAKDSVPAPASPSTVPDKHITSTPDPTSADQNSTVPPNPAFGSLASAPPHASGSQVQPKVLLARAISCPAVKIDYRDMPGKPKKDKNGREQFAVGVFFTGWGTSDKLLAVGVAPKKTEAGHKAAEEALRNKKLMELYGEKKQAFLLARDGPAVGSEI